MTDDDVAFWSDILYMRGLADAIEDAISGSDTGLATFAYDQIDAGLEYTIDQYLDPWPGDRAADMLDAWLNNPTWVGPIRVPIDQLR
jgi:hypothetical protein